MISKELFSYMYLEWGYIKKYDLDIYKWEKGKK